MMHFRQAILVLDKKEYSLTVGKINSFDAFYVDFQAENNGKDGAHYALFIHPKQDVLVEKIELQFDLPSTDCSNITTYGLHSGADSTTVGLDHKSAKQEGLFKNDPFLSPVPTGKGMVHSWSFMQFKGIKKEIWAASGNESTGFTALLYDAQQQILTVRKDVGRGMRMTHSFPALDFYIGPKIPQPEERLAPVKALVAAQDNLTDAGVLTAFLEKTKASGLPFTHFLIANGWQMHHGDGLQNRAVQGFAAAIRQFGLKAGLTISPFTAGVQSDLARRNPDWLLQHNGQPVQIRAANGSTVYALDVYHAGVREYLNGLFHLLTERSGYGWFVLEDMYAACLVPKSEKTRGQVMHEAITLLRQAVGNAQLVGCQVPMGAATGYLDAVQMGNSAYYLKNDQLEWQHQNEQLHVASLVAAQPLRHQLWSVGGHTLCLRATKDRKNAAAQYSYLVANALLTDILVVQDDIERYSPEIRCELDEAIALQEATQVVVAPTGTQVLKLGYFLDKKQYYTYINTGKKATIENGLILEAYETV